MLGIILPDLTLPYQIHHHHTRLTTNLPDLIPPYQIWHNLIPNYQIWYHLIRSDTTWHHLTRSDTTWPDLTKPYQSKGESLSETSLNDPSLDMVGQLVHRELKNKQTNKQQNVFTGSW